MHIFSFLSLYNPWKQSKAFKWYFMLKTLVASKISENSSLVQVLLCTFQLLQSDPKVIGNYIEQFLSFLLHYGSCKGVDSM